MQQGMSFGQAAQTYTLLTVGDGLVTQIPALLISSATGMIVTRATAESNMGADMLGQLTNQPKALWIASGVLFVLGLVPGLPSVPFFVLAIFIGTMGYLMYRTQVATEAEISEEERREEEVAVEPGKPDQEELSELIKVDQIEVEVGYNLISLVLPEQGGDFLDRVAMIRRQTAMDLGIVVPPVRILDNLQLEPDIYRIKLKGVEVSRFQLFPNRFLALESGVTTEEIEGIETEEPAFGTPAIWIEESQKEQAEMSNYTVVDPPSVMATHLTEVIKDHAHELLGRQEVQDLLDNMEENYPAVVEELVPDLMSLGEIQKVLQNLLWEEIPIKNLVTILETLADYAPKTKDINVLTEYVRQALSRQITDIFSGENKTLHAVTIDPQLEDQLNQALDQSDQGNYLALEPQEAQDLINRIVEKVQSLLEQGHKPILLTSPVIRRPLKELTSRSFEDLIVLSFNELESDVNLQVVGKVT
ncbi:MAG: flagellar biosynthesis protein FlhA, partial [Bacillota bacterium]